MTVQCVMLARKRIKNRKEKMFRNVFAVFLLLFYVVSAFAGGGDNVRKHMKTWGFGNSWASCQNHSLVGSEACIGQSESDNCEPKKMYARDHTDEYALQVMVAMTVTDKGARFCPVQIEGKNRNEGNAWTEYAQISGGDCVWLCRNGFSGEQCDKSVDALTSCDPTPLRRSDYSNLKRVVSGANVENDVSMFDWNRRYGCGVNKWQEHDVILVIVKWLEEGHGAWVRPMIVRAQRDGWDNMISWAALYPPNNSQETLVCKNGYKPVGTDCVEINSNLCAAAQACQGWNGFDENLHKFVSKNGCYEFRCKESGKAFVSETDRTCEPCNVDMRTGILTGNGVCHTCEKGKFFKDDVDAPCGDAIGYTKLDMQYGKGKTKASQRNLEDQCWVNTESDKYRQCVLNGGPVGDVPGGDDV